MWISHPINSHMTAPTNQTIHPRTLNEVLELPAVQGPARDRRQSHRRHRIPNAPIPAPQTGAPVVAAGTRQCRRAALIAVIVPYVRILLLPWHRQRLLRLRPLLDGGGDGGGRGAADAGDDGRGWVAGGLCWGGAGSRSVSDRTTGNAGCATTTNVPLWRRPQPLRRQQWAVCCCCYCVVRAAARPG